MSGVGSIELHESEKKLWSVLCDIAISLVQNADRKRTSHENLQKEITAKKEFINELIHALGKRGLVEELETLALRLFSIAPIGWTEFRESTLEVSVFGFKDSRIWISNHSIHHPSIHPSFHQIKIND